MDRIETEKAKESHTKYIYIFLMEPFYLYLFICKFLDTDDIIQLVKSFQFTNWCFFNIAMTLGELRLSDV